MHLCMPSPLPMQAYYAEVWVHQHEVKEDTVLFQELPHALRNEVAWHATHRMFRSVRPGAEGGGERGGCEWRSGRQVGVGVMNDALQGSPPPDPSPAHSRLLCPLLPLP